MQLEGGARVDRDERLDRLASCLQRIIRDERPLINSSEEYSKSPVAQELDRWVDRVEHHRADDNHSDFIEPVSVEISVEPIVEIL